MEKHLTMHAEQLMVPELEVQSHPVINQMHFLMEMVPLLETLRSQAPESYEALMDSFRQHFFGQKRVNFEDVLEYCLVYLKNSLGMNLEVERGPEEYQMSSVNCPLITLQAQRGPTNDLQRKTLCFHCHEFHLRKFFRMFRLHSSLQLYPNGCQVSVERERSEKINPLFY